MADVIFVAVVCAFFGLCVVYIRGCDRIIGPDDASPSVVAGPADGLADDAALPVGVPTVGVPA